MEGVAISGTHCFSNNVNETVNHRAWFHLSILHLTSLTVKAWKREELEQISGDGAELPKEMLSDTMLKALEHWFRGCCDDVIFYNLAIPSDGAFILPLGLFLLLSVSLNKTSGYERIRGLHHFKHQIFAKQSIETECDPLCRLSLGGYISQGDTVFDMGVEPVVKEYEELEQKGEGFEVNDRNEGEERKRTLSFTNDVNV